MLCSKPLQVLFKKQSCISVSVSIWKKIGCFCCYCCCCCVVVAVVVVVVGVVVVVVVVRWGGSFFMTDRFIDFTATSKNQCFSN